MKTAVRRQLKKKFRKQRRFAKVDLACLPEEDEHENPDWLVGAN